MTKKQMKERALLLLAYAFMKETFERSKDVPLSEIIKADLTFTAVYKKLDGIKRLNLTKEIVITENLEELTEAIVKSVDFETAKSSIEFASELVADVFPDQRGLIEFRKISGKFPFSLIKESENDRKSA